MGRCKHEPLRVQRVGQAQAPGMFVHPEIDTAIHAVHDLQAQQISAKVPSGAEIRYLKPDIAKRLDFTGHRLCPQMAAGQRHEIVKALRLYPMATAPKHVELRIGNGAP